MRIHFMGIATGEDGIASSEVSDENGEIFLRKHQRSAAQSRAMHMRRRENRLYDMIDAMNLGYETFSYEDLCERLGISR